MFKVLANSWPLLLGVMLLMVGNGMQSTLLGIRGAIEGFSTFHISVVMSAYFVGFLGGSQLAPTLIAKVGHVRVFSALGSLISAILVIYPVAPDWIAWSLMRVVMGFCFSGVYVTAESWLNDTATNETRGQTLSLYMIVQMIGIIAAQALMTVSAPDGFVLFVIPSVLVSLSFTPILLSKAPAPTFAATKGMSFRKLFRVSPLGCVGMFLIGGIYAALFGMAAVWGTLTGLSVSQISLFVAAIYLGGMVFQYPIGWLSDRMDRRRLISVLALAGAVVTLAGAFNPGFSLILVIALIAGGIINPLYSLLIAHTNDFIDAREMAGASGGMIFINGLGAISGPMIVGWMIGFVGPGGFFLFVSLLMLLMAIYAAYRMTRRAAPVGPGVGSYTSVVPTAGAVALDAVRDKRPSP
jgi:MFS family permease